MKFNSEMKKIYKSIKNGFSSFFQKIGFDKKKANNIARSTCLELPKSWKRMGVDGKLVDFWSSFSKEEAHEYKKKDIIPLVPTRPAPAIPNSKDLIKKDEISTANKIRFNPDLPPRVSVGEQPGTSGTQQKTKKIIDLYKQNQDSEETVSLSSYHSALDSEEFENEI